MVDEKLPTFTEEEVRALFEAKQADLGISPFPVQQLRFQDLCRKVCINRRIIFNEMNLGLNFASTLAEILRQDKHRFVRLNLRKNLLQDAGIKELMHEIRKSKSLVELDFASNEISNEGMLIIFKSLAENESVIALNLATIDGVGRNRISATGIQELKNCLKVNRFIE